VTDANRGGGRSGGGYAGTVRHTVDTMAAIDDGAALTAEGPASRFKSGPAHLTMEESCAVLDVEGLY